MSLINQFKESIYPLEQKLDIESIHWIQEQKPKFFNSGFNLDNFNIRAFELPELPPIKWFLNPPLHASIHGIMHLMRVFIHIKILIENENLTDVERNSLLLSALLHDLRRENDRKDKYHGKRASDWFKANFDVVIKYYSRFDKCSKKLTSFIIKHHQDGIIPLKSKFSEREVYLLKIFKIADAMDRFRLPNTSWWLDKRFIFHPINDKHILFAFNLVVESEIAYLQSHNWFDSINSALNKYKA